jgi:hypothetical protein
MSSRGKPPALSFVSKGIEVASVSWNIIAVTGLMGKCHSNGNNSFSQVIDAEGQL